MKKFLLLFGLSCITFLGNAQVETTRGYLMANVGGNYASFFQSSSNTTDLHGILGPSAGLSIRVIAPTWWGFETGLNYAVKGADFKDSIGKARISYAGASFDGLLFFPLVHDNNVYVGMGIYTAYALAGKLKSDSTETDIDFGGDTWKSFDVGMRFKAGITIRNTIGFGVHYDLGLVPVYTGVDLRGETNHGRNSVFNLSAYIKLASIFNK